MDCIICPVLRKEYIRVVTRQPDTLFSGPDIQPTEAMRRRFFAEDA